MHGGNVETIVALNRCTDRTGEIALSLGARTVATEARNLAAVRNAGAREARGEMIVTIDADSSMAPNTLVEIERRLRRGREVGGGAMIWPDRWSIGITASACLVLLMVAPFKISAGMFWLMRKDFESLGGFNESFVSAEDIEFGVRLRALGKQRGQRYGTLWNAPITTSCRKFDHFGDWFAVRNAKLIRAIISGKDAGAANLFYYDFPRV